MQVGCVKERRKFQNQKRKIMASENFHGAFVFRDQGHGILSSTYFNTTTPKPYPETAILKKNCSKSDPFLGEFETVWLDENDHFKLKLIISKNTNYSEAYDLKWSSIGNDQHIEWEGLGNIENGLLIGCYWGV